MRWSGRVEETHETIILRNGLNWNITCWSYPHTVAIVVVVVDITGFDRRRFAAEKGAPHKADTHRDCGVVQFSPKQRWRWAMLWGSLKQTQFPSSDPFAALNYPLRSPLIIVWVLFWVGVAPFRLSLRSFLLLLRLRPLLLQLGSLGTQPFVAVVVAAAPAAASTTGMTLMGLLWNGIGIGGAAISLRLNKLRAFPLFSRYPLFSFSSFSYLFEE